ncbi:MAG: hydrogenase [Candidatus Woesearchaeota archaeon]
MISAIQTNEGIWYPLVLIVASVLILLIVYIIRSIGNKRYKEGTAQTRPFLSGNLTEPEGDLRSSDMYWGFFDAFAPVYRILMRCHTGIVNDYIGAFVVVLALLLIMIILI